MKDTTNMLKTKKALRDISFFITNIIISLFFKPVWPYSFETVLNIGDFAKFLSLYHKIKPPYVSLHSFTVHLLIHPFCRQFSHTINSQAWTFLTSNKHQQRLKQLPLDFFLIFNISSCFFFSPASLMPPI